MTDVPCPLATPEVRLAYHGQLKTRGWEDVILKEFKHIGDGVHTLDRYRQQIEASTIADFLVSGTPNASPYLTISDET